MARHRQIDVETPAADAARMWNYVARQVIKNGGYWVPACGGAETPFKARSGLIMLYCWNPVTGEHAYMDVASDMVMTDDDAAAHMDMH